ncbi:hypothetical protein CMI47_13315 [Candidatus Pacearchaeota archaeon]|nr:hypothetical protein [Candidatus Pacearchaeota archaeon]|tara:strand:- start:349 stop:669 length:321 start_codon:yes stop_codon:yes gene_type:complete
MNISKEDIFVALDKKLRSAYGIPIDKRPICELIGKDGNAYAIMGRVSRALKKAGFKHKIDEYIRRATSSDYNNLLCVTLDYVRDRYIIDPKYAIAIDYLNETKEKG